MGVDIILTILDEAISALASMGSAILDNWKSFLILTIIYTIIVVYIVKFLYKHKQESLDYREDLVNKKASEIDNIKKELKELQEENAKMKMEISSSEYQAYLGARELYKNDLDDSNMFR